MQLLNLFAFPTLWVLLAAAAAAQSPFTCARVDKTGVVRADGLAELLPDIVLDCTGGNAGTAQANFTFLVTVKGTWATRPPFPPPVTPGAPVTPLNPLLPILPTPSWNEALLLVDDPQPQVQTFCLPTPKFDSCNPGSTANVFPARALENNLIAFPEIPLPAGGKDKRRLRVTNLRVNVPRSTAKADSITTTVQAFDSRGNVVSIDAPERVSATAQPSLTLRLLDVAGNAVSEVSPALITSPANLPRNEPGTTVAFHVAFEEGTPTAFRRRNIATTPLRPGNVQSQNVPGLTYNTESGFFDTRLPLHTALSLAGSADSGTRLRLNLSNIPRNVLVWVSLRDVETGTRNYDPVHAKAVLTETSANGDGPFRPATPSLEGWYLLQADVDGNALAVWEVVSADPAAVDRISVRLALSSERGAGTGAATIRGSVAPFLEGTETILLNAIPRFQVPAKEIAAFTVTNSLQTAPASITSAASFSGVAISPGSFAAAFAPGVAAGTTVPDFPWPTIVDGLQMQIVDATGVSRLAPILLVSPGQVNFLLPESTPSGTAFISILRQGVAFASGLSNIQASAPALFSADGTGRGFAAGAALRLTTSGSNPAQPFAVFDAGTSLWRPLPVTLGEPVFLSLYGTGIRRRGNLDGVTATLGGQAIPVLYAGPQSELPGLDQINLGPLPESLRGRGELELIIVVEGLETNRVRIAVE